LKSFLDLIPLAEPQKRSPPDNSLVSSVAWFYFWAGFRKKQLSQPQSTPDRRTKKTLNVKPVSTPLAARLYGENTQSIELSAKWYLLAERRQDMTRKKFRKKNKQNKTKQKTNEG